MGWKARWGLVALLIVSIGLIVIVIQVSQRPRSSPPPTLAAQVTATSGVANPGGFLGQRTKTSGCVVRGSLPDPACTPGAVLTTDSRVVCASGYASKTRDVTTSTKNKAYAEYGIANHKAGEYEVDHLVSLELGGSNDLANLWPEAANASPGYHEKDKVENYLHGLVCSGAMTLQQAQYEIATDWVSIYNTLTP
jgi:hypothetical protein